MGMGLWNAMEAGMCLLTRQPEDVLDRLDKPLIVYHIKILEWLTLAGVLIGAALLAAPGLSMQGSLFVATYKVMAEPWWAFWFAVFGLVHLGALVANGHHPLTTPIVRVAAISGALGLYIMMLSAAMAVNPWRYEVHLLTMPVAFNAVCLLRAAYDAAHAWRSRNVGGNRKRDP